MDIDDDDFGSTDPIERFLDNKLKEVRADRTNLLSALNTRQSLILEEQSKLQVATSSPSFRIEEVWKKLWNGKYAIGIVLETACDKNENTYEVILQWDSQLPLTYTTHRKVVTDQQTCLVVVLEVPDFSKQLAYTLSGTASPITDGNSVFVPPVELRPSDVADCHLKDVLRHLEAGNLQCFLTYTHCCEKSVFYMSLPTFAAQRFVESILEIDCGLTKFVHNQQIYFFAHNINPAVDGCLLRVDRLEHPHTNFEVTLYYRDEESATLLIHHLQTHINGMLLLPPDLRQFAKSLDVDICKRNFQKALREEVDFPQQYWKSKHSSGHNTCKQYRMQLTRIEKDTDCAVKIARLVGCLEEEMEL